MRTRGMLYTMRQRGLLTSYPVVGIVAAVRSGDGGEVSGLFGGVLTAVTVRVSSEADSRTGAETAHGRSPGSASEAAFRETPLDKRSGSNQGWRAGPVWKAATFRHGRQDVPVAVPVGCRDRISLADVAESGRHRGQDSVCVFWPRLARKDDTHGILPGSQGCGGWGSAYVPAS